MQKAYSEDINTDISINESSYSKFNDGGIIINASN